MFASQDSGLLLPATWAGSKSSENWRLSDSSSGVSLIFFPLDLPQPLETQTYCPIHSSYSENFIPDGSGLGREVLTPHKSSLRCSTFPTPDVFSPQHYSS